MKKEKAVIRRLLDAFVKWCIWFYRPFSWESHKQLEEAKEIIRDNSVMAEFEKREQQVKTFMDKLSSKSTEEIIEAVHKPYPDGLLYYCGTVEKITLELVIRLHEKRKDNKLAKAIIHT